MRNPLNIFFLVFLAILIYILKRENEGIVADEERSDQVHKNFYIIIRYTYSHFD